MFVPKDGVFSLEVFDFSSKTNKRTCFDFFPECVAKGSRLTWESEGRAVFAGRCFRVRNRPQPSSSVRIRLLWPCRWGEL